MAQVLRLRADPPRPTHRPRAAITSSSAPFPSFVPGASFDPSLPSRREALSEFQEYEMMAEVEDRLRADADLVLSDTDIPNDFGYLNHRHSYLEDMDEVGGLNAEDEQRYSVPAFGNPNAHADIFPVAVTSALRTARAELSGRASLSSVWDDAAREAFLHDSDHVMDADPTRPLRGEEEEDGLLAELDALRARIDAARHRQSSQTEGSDALGGMVEEEFVPERYVAPLLQSEGLHAGAAALLFGPTVKETAREALESILPDAASLREARELLGFSLQSGRPDVLACAKRCQAAQQQHHPTTAIITESKAETQEGGHDVMEMARQERRRKGKQEEECARSGPSPSPQPMMATTSPATRTSTAKVSYPQPSAKELAEMIAQTLPPIPSELFDELVQQRQLLQRLSSAQEECLRRLAREQQEATRRRIMAPRPDYTLGGLTLKQTEPYEVAEAIQNAQQDPSRPLPPVITITAAPQRFVAAAATTSIAPPQPPPFFVGAELDRLQRQYEQLLRDERRAWTDLMERQKETLERDKAVAVENIRRSTARQQQQSTKEIARAIAASEVRRQRWQHAGEVQQQMALEEIVRKAIPPLLAHTERRETVSPARRGLKQETVERSRRKQRPIIKAAGAVSAEKESVAREEGSKTKEEEEEKEEEDAVDEALETETKVEHDGKGRAMKQVHKKITQQTRAKGPYRVVLPPEETRAEHIVVLSDADSTQGAATVSRSKQAPLAFTETTGGARVYTGRKQSPYAAKPTGKKSASSATPRRPSVVRKRGAQSQAKHRTMQQRRAGERGKARDQEPQSHDEKDPVHAFEVHVEPRIFDYTAESELSTSSSCTISPTSLGHGPNASVPIRLYSDLALTHIGRREGEALFQAPVLLLSDQLSPTEAEQRQLTDRAFDIHRVPLEAQETATTEELAMGRACDVYYFGVEREELSPHRRGELRAAEAQTLLAARQRLERIKAFSITPSHPQGFGAAPVGSSRFPKEETHAGDDELEGDQAVMRQRLADAIANETIHSMIGEAVEQSVFPEVMRELTAEVLRAELHRIAEKGSPTPRADGAAGGMHEEEVPVRARATASGVGLSGTQVFSVAVNEEDSPSATLLRRVGEALLETLLQSELVDPSTAVTAQPLRAEESVAPAVTPTVATSSAVLTSSAVEPPRWVQEVVAAPGTDPLWRDAPISTESDKTVENQTSLATKQETAETRAAIAPSIVLALEGTGNSSLRAGPDGTLRLVLDVGPLAQHVSSSMTGGNANSMGITRGEERRLHCAAEEDLTQCEIVEVELLAHAPPIPARVVTPSLPRTHPIPSVTVSPVTSGLSVQRMPPPPPPPPLPPHAVVAPMQSIVPMQNFTGERRRLEEEEARQRTVALDQEESMRSSLHMMWDWQRTNMILWNQQQQQQQQWMRQQEQMEQQQKKRYEKEQQHEVKERSQHPLHEVDQPRDSITAGSATKDRHPSSLPPVPARGISDPITKFIFEWLHDYDAQQSTTQHRVGFADRLREASQVASQRPPPYPDKDRPNPKDDTSGVDSSSHVRRRLLMDVHAASSPSWLSSTHPSSLSEDGLPRFATARREETRRRGTVPPARAWRPIGERTSSATTETTLFGGATTSSSPWNVPGASAADSGTTQTTPSTRVTSNSSSQPKREEAPLAMQELRRRVETLQEAEGAEGRRWGFVDAALVRTGAPVEALRQPPQLPNPQP